MENVIAALVVALILGGAIAYIVREKKKGRKCIGCPYAKQCSGKCGGNHSSETENSKIS